MIDHSDDNGGGDYYPEEDPFDPSDPKYQPRGGSRGGGGGGSRYDVPPPASRYPVVIDRWEMSEEPGGSGYHFINMAMSIQMEGNWHRFFIWEILSYSPKSEARWAALFNALGWTPAHGPFNRTDPNVLAQWFDSGIIFWVQTKIETYRGKRKAKIAYYIPREEQPPMGADGHPQGQPQDNRPAGRPMSQDGHTQGDGQEDYPPPQQDPSGIQDPFSSDFEGGGGSGSGTGGEPDDDDSMPF